MAVSSRFTSPTFMTPELIKPHLEYDGESHRLSVTDLWKISATHGTTIESAVDLLFNHGFTRDHFVKNDSESRGKRDFNKEFYTTPNPRFSFDVDEIEGEFSMSTFSDVDAIKAGIEYAEGGNSDYDNGVVIAFSGRLSLDGAEISVDPLSYSHAESSLGFELVLPEAPGIDVIEGIYAVDQQAFEDLWTSILEPMNQRR